MNCLFGVSRTLATKSWKLSQINLLSLPLEIMDRTSHGKVTVSRRD
jgi:hypothetical protein